MKPIYVVCFYWQGERWQETGNQYDEVEDNSFRRHLNRVGPNSRELVHRYVNNLYLGVERWAVHPFKFVCFTNEDLQVDSNIELRPFELVTHKGVLPRMVMFSEAAGLFGSQVLCLDLDVVIAGPLRDLMNYTGTFCVRRGFDRAQANLLDGDIMSFKAGKDTEEMFWKPLIENVEEAERITTGRERFWVREVTNGKAETWEALAPGRVVSYKHHVKRNGGILPHGASIVSCHGHPRPHQINEQWRTENWK